MLRERRRWNTRFGSWVATVGVSRLTHELCSRNLPVTERAVYGWLAGRHAPRLPHIAVIMDLSQGQLTLQDLHHHHVQLGRREEP